MNTVGRSVTGGMIAMLFCMSPVNSGVSLELLRVGPPVEPGGTIYYELWLHVPCDDPTTRATGFQAFLQYHRAQLVFVRGRYTPSPFGQPLLAIAAQDGTLTLAAGLNAMAGQPPACGSHLLAVLRFEALATEGPCNALAFRPHTPASKVVGLWGAELGPLVLVSSALPMPLLDLDGDCRVTGWDGVQLAVCLGGPAQDWPSADCNPLVFAAGDLDFDGTVDLADVAVFQAQFAPE